MKTQFSSEDQVVSFINKLVGSTDGIGIGDDAAVVTVGNKKLVMSTDSLIEDVHFKKEWVTPFYLGRKAMLVNLSDLAAMGASPRWILVSLILPQIYFHKGFIRDLYQGFNIETEEFDLKIMGGNITRGDKICITLTLLGTIEIQPLTRDGAQKGDLIFVSGNLGNASAEIKKLLSQNKKSMLYLPETRIDFGGLLAKEEIATACIDISDGLVKDLSRVCTSSEVGAILLENNLPQNNSLDSILFGGEDYELLFTVPEKKIDKLYDVAAKTATPINFLGQMKFNRGVFLEKTDGTIIKLPNKGWDHIQKI